MIISQILSWVTLLLVVVGCMGVLATLVSPHHSRTAPFFGFGCLFAVAGAVLVSVSAADLFARLSGSTLIGLYAFVVGYGLGCLAGGDLGRRLARLYEQRILPRRVAAPLP